MFCENCGNELKENALFCNKCGCKTGVEEPMACLRLDQYNIYLVYALFYLAAVMGSLGNRYRLCCIRHCSNGSVHDGDKKIVAD